MRYPLGASPRRHGRPMSDTIVLLQLEHRNIARLLTVLEHDCARLQADATADLGVVVSALEYFVDYPDRCHHPKEDRVFRRLEQCDPALAHEVGDLLADHEDVSRFAGEMARRAGAARTRGVDAEFVLRLRQFIKVYRDHLQAEEEHFFPAVLSTLTREDWETIDFDVFDREDPLFDHAVEERFRALRHLIRDAASGHGGAASADG
jgi:hemerythrin-like domain-containing protein